MKTKKEIIAATKTKRGDGFFSVYSFSTDIEINGENHFFEKPFNSNTGTEIYLTTLDGNYVPQHKFIGDCDNKAEYINVLYKYINNILG